MNIFSKRVIIGIGSACIGSLALVSTAFAAGQGAPGHGLGMQVNRPAIVGSVASISGSTFTVTARSFVRGEASSTPKTVTYTVDASSATIKKDNATSTVSAITVGDRVFVLGTVSGTNVTATAVEDGKPNPFSGMPMLTPHKRMGMASDTPLVAGNGEPVIGGNVTDVNGDSLTVTNTSNVTYTIDASGATVTKKGVASASVSDVAVGDSVIIQGTVNGSAVTASSVIDKGTVPTKSAPKGGFMQTVGGLLSRLFGFF